MIGLCVCSFLSVVEARCETPSQPGSSIVDAGPLLGQIHVSGVTIYDADVTVLYAAGYVREHHGVLNMPSVAAAIQYLYREHGYFLAEALVFTDPNTGRAHIVVEEGVLSGIEVVGVEEALGLRVASYFQHLLNGLPVTKAEFERALMLAGDLSGMLVRAEIRHDGAGKRAVTLHVKTERQRLMALADYGPRQNMASLTLTGEAYSRITPGDMIRVSLGGARHFDANDQGINLAAAYRVPIGNEGTYGELLIANTRYGRDLSGNLSDSRFQDGKNMIALLGHPFLRNIHEFLYGFVEYDYAELDAGPSGTSNDSSQTIRLAFYYSSIGHGFGTFRAGATVSAGVAESNSAGLVDDMFFHVRAGAGVVLHLDPPQGDYSLRIEGMGQLTSAALPATEKFYLGDRDRMRGYNIATTLGDSGFTGTVELSRYVAIEAQTIKAFSPAVFVDAGIVQTNNAYPMPYSSKTLASTGLAGRLFLRDDFTLSAWVALPLVEDGRDSYMKPAGYVRLTKVW